MPRKDKSSYTDEQKRQAMHIVERDDKHGISALGSEKALRHR